MMTKVCFCGVSGNGMSPLAQILKLQGFDVYGSDKSFDSEKDKKNLQALIDVGIKIIPQDGSGITPDMDTIYVSAALDEKNPDIIAGRKFNIKIKKRSELLADIFHQYKCKIAIGGTSGKSTTSAMVGYVLDMLGKKPCLVNGALLRNYEQLKELPNYIYNKDEYCVIEADESDGSICNYRANIGLINNISHDHTSIENLMSYFNKFANNTSDAVILNYDCVLSKELKTDTKKVYVSTKDDRADFYAYDIKQLPQYVEYFFRGQAFKLNLVGVFNVSNAIAAIAVCAQAGIDPMEAAKALEGFVGVKRRLEKVGTSKRGITLIDDFAHNPDKIYSSLKAIKGLGSRVIAMYQPHHAFSVQNTGKEVAKSVAKALGDDDIFIMPEIYMLDKNVDPNTSSLDIVNQAKEMGLKNGVFVHSHQEVYDYIIKNAKDNDIIIIMGARDNSLPDFSKKLLQNL